MPSLEPSLYLDSLTVIKGLEVFNVNMLRSYCYPGLEGLVSEPHDPLVRPD